MDIFKKTVLAITASVLVVFVASGPVIAADFPAKEIRLNDKGR